MFVITTHRKRRKLIKQAYIDGYAQGFDEGAIYAHTATRINDINQAFEKGIKQLQRLGEGYCSTPVPEVWLEGWEKEC